MINFALRKKKKKKKILFASNSIITNRHFKFKVLDRSDAYTSDHCPLRFVIPFADYAHEEGRRIIEPNSEEEDEFVEEIIVGLKNLSRGIGDMDTVPTLKGAVELISSSLLDLLPLPSY